MLSANPWYGPANPWYGPANPWYGPATPGMVPLTPGMGPANSWYGPANPWYANHCSPSVSLPFAAIEEEKENEANPSKRTANGKDHLHPFGVCCHLRAYGRQGCRAPSRFRCPSPRYGYNPTGCVSTPWPGGSTLTLCGSSRTGRALCGTPQVGWALRGLPQAGWTLRGLPQAGWTLCGSPQAGWTLCGSAQADWLLRGIIRFGCL